MFFQKQELAKANSFLEVFKFFKLLALLVFLVKNTLKKPYKM
jgi:hypothetical protein